MSPSKIILVRKLNTSTTSKIEEHDQSMDIRDTIEMTELSQRYVAPMYFWQRSTYFQHVRNQIASRKLKSLGILKLSSARLVETDF